MGVTKQKHLKKTTTNFVNFYHLDVKGCNPKGNQTFRF